MLNRIKMVILPILLLTFVLSSINLDSRPKEDKYNADNLMRTAVGIYDLQENTVSNIQFYTTNYGIFGLNVFQNRGGGFWPRNSQNQYIFAGGIWLGAIKKRPNDTNYRKYVTITYNPNSGSSWMVPGRMNKDNTSEDQINLNEQTKYRTYFSTDFNSGDGTAITSADGEAWPIWDTSLEDTLRNNRYFGNYLDAVSDRDLTLSPKGPAFISGEDIFATFKDTDLSRYDDGAGQRRNQGYPLRLQYEQMIYSWGFGDYKDFIFLKYEIANYSQDTLLECWMAPVMDIDIALAQNSQNGAENDRCRFYDEDESLNMALQWSEGTQGEQGQGFGYLGFDFLESPAVYESHWRKIQEVVNGNVSTYNIRDYMALEDKDTTIIVMKVESTDTLYVPKDTVIVLKDTLVKHQIMVITDNGGVLDTNLTVEFDITTYLRKDKKFYKNKEQLGLQTFRNWPIAEDKSGDDERYNYMASRTRDGDDGAGDKRFMMATGPFHMIPGDTVRVVVGLLCAKPFARDEPDGSEEDLETLVALDKFAQSVYDDNFRAPKPPDAARFLDETWTPLNNAIQFQWDNTSEMSEDIYEDGLDFLGYRIERARRIDLDTFNLYQIGSTTKYPKGQGPFGWKQIASYQLPLPFQTSYLQAGNEINKDPNFPFIDSLRIVGPYYNNDGTIDSTLIRIMRIGQGVRLVPDSVIKANNLFAAYPFSGAVIPMISLIDTAFFAKPWGPYYSSLVDQSEYLLWYNPYTPSSNSNRFLNEVAIGRLKLDPALVKFNPLLNKVQTININPLDTPLIPDKVGDTIYLKDTYREATIDGQKALLIDRVIPLPINDCMKDTIHIQNVLRTSYALIKQGSAQTVFPDFESSNEAKTLVISPYMAEITNNRTFIDIGDDNRDGIVQTNADPTKTEKLLNSVEYYYRVISWDQGDYNQPTPLKPNNASTGLPNQMQTHPAASPAGDYSQFEVIYVDSNKIGGLYNFSFYAVNPDRVNQLFAGHELELEFNPWWNLSTIELTTTNPFIFGLYYRDMNLTDITTGDILFQGRIMLESTPCQFNWRGLFTENAVSWYLSDTVIVDPNDPNKNDDFGTPYSQGIKNRTGYFTTGDFTLPGYCYSAPFMPPAKNVIGFSFDYSVYQYGGKYRPDTVKVKTPGVVTNVVPMQAIQYPEILGTITTGEDGFNTVIQDWRGAGRGSLSYGSLNNGPGDYTLKFKPGGNETLELKFQNGTQTNTFNVSYLEMEIANNLSHFRPDASMDSVSFNYTSIMSPVEITDTLVSYGLPDIFAHYNRNGKEYYNKFNSSTIAWVNARYDNRPTQIGRQRAYPTNAQNVVSNTQVLEKQNRYYLSAISIDGVDTVDFVNVVNVAGAYFSFDYPNKGRFERSSTQWNPIDDYVYGADFKAGDEVVLPVRGGAFGLPAPGAKVRVKVSASAPVDNNYTDDMMNQIKAVPNPYYISHQMQKSPYDSKLFFTKLPPVCTISIYTVTGDLIKEIRHDESTANDPTNHAVDVWNLLSSNSQRVQSQTLIAIIKSANGAESVVPFSVVVGGFRLMPEDQ